MKARNFRYVRPTTLGQACRILADAGGDAVPIAGGQSLLAGLNMRLSAPKLLVDIADLEELRGQSRTDNVVRLGALTRHGELLASDLVRTHVPLLTQAVPYIGHVAIRNRGTLGGSLAYADPAAELPACTVALGATLLLASAAGERRVKAGDFFKGLFETDLHPGELIVAVEWPIQQTGAATGFAELSRRRGDFALAGIAAVATIRTGRIGEACLVYLGCADRAKVARTVSQAVAGLQTPIADGAAYEDALRHDLAPDDTPGLRGETRLRMASVLTRQVLNAMSERAAA
jgi:carbon-monoxide dehydrogenase medium subunit